MCNKLCKDFLCTLFVINGYFGKVDSYFHLLIFFFFGLILSVVPHFDPMSGWQMRLLNFV